MKFRALLVLFVVFSLVLHGCSSPETQNPTEVIKLKLQLIPFLSNAPLYIALEEGYFSEQGLDVETMNIMGPEAFVALVQGEIDVYANFLTSNLLSSIAEGQNVKAVADKGFVDPNNCAVNALLMNKELIDSGRVKEVKDLAGLTIKYDKVSVQAYYLEKLLETAGLTLADVTLHDFDSPAVALDALSSGAIDGGVEGEPWLTRNTNSGKTVVWKDMKDLIPDFQFGFIMYGPNLLEKNPEAGRRFMVAYLKAIRQYNQGKTPRNIELLTTFTGLDAELLQQICWPSFRQDLLVNTQSILDFQDWAIGQDLLDHAVTVKDVWDPSFAEFALDNLK